nr:hypothetical protein GCM10020063_009370 [Dactylosporangium thailandense]
MLPHVNRESGAAEGRSWPEAVFLQHLADTRIMKAKRLVSCGSVSGVSCCHSSAITADTLAVAGVTQQAVVTLQWTADADVWRGCALTSQHERHARSSAWS